MNYHLVLNKGIVLLRMKTISLHFFNNYFIKHLHNTSSLNFAHFCISCALSLAAFAFASRNIK